jgi:cytochrome c-type biogenesis protein CcmH/NrfF
MLIAHVGHWIGYVLYAIPVVILVVGAIRAGRIARRHAADGDSGRAAQEDVGAP